MAHIFHQLWNAVYTYAAEYETGLCKSPGCQPDLGMHIVSALKLFTVTVEIGPYARIQSF